MALKGIALFLGAALVALAETSWAERASNWRVYKVADGLAESACLSVTVAPQGKVLARHLNLQSISELDGYAVNSIPAPEKGSSRVYESPSGQLWTVAPEGLQEFKEGAWMVHPVAEIADNIRAGSPIDPVPLCPVRQGVVICLLPDRVMEFDAEDPDHPRTKVLRRLGQTHLGKFCGMTPAHDGGLWIAGARGLAKVTGPARNLTPESEWREYSLPEALQIHYLQEPQEDQEGGVTAVAESATNQQKVLAHFDGQHWTAQPAGAEKLRYGWRGPDNTGWASTIRSLFQVQEGSVELNEYEEISAGQFFDLAVERGGAFWLATAEGLFRYAPAAWSSPGAVERITTPIHCLTEDAAGRLWFVSGGRLHSLQEDRHQEYPFPPAMLRHLQAARALFSLRDKTLVLDADGHLFQFQPGGGVFRTVSAHDQAVEFKSLGLLADGRLCVQSSNADDPDQKSHLEVYDGARFESFPEPPPDAAFGSNITCAFAAKNGDLWLSAERGLAWRHDNRWRTFVSADKTSPEAARCFAEQADGRLWCATHDRIWEFDGRTWSEVRRGFDGIEGLVRARDGSLWVVCNSGLSRFVQGAWVENSADEGLPSASVRAVYEDQHGRIWAATTRGLSLYHPEADSDPPQTHIEKLPDKAQHTREGDTLTLNFSAQDKWKYTPRERLLYSHRLDEGDWSSFQEVNSVSFRDLAAGKHIFQVRAMDRNCNADPKPARLEFAVVLPWYKETRLVLISLAGMAAVLFFAGLAFNRHRQLLRSYAEVEKQVQQRTRELETANRELLHSQKMNALGTLAAGIAHDFNNILSIIKGSAQIIEDNLNDPQKVRTRLDRIKTVVEQGAGIVKAMLGFSREEDRKPGACDLNSVVEDTLQLLGDRFQREVEVSFERGRALPEICGSRDLIQQILLNFIFNAAESMTQRKRIILATRQVDQLPGGLVLTPAKAAAYAAISIRDFGCGIPPENMSRIFEPFFTTKALSVRRGTGLGLSMVYELAKKMEAGLAVESIVDEGSTFTLFLPVQASRTESAGESKQPRKGRHEPSESISEAQTPSR